MKRIQQFSLALAAIAFSGNSAIASTAYGDLNNFDAVNDTGLECHGFEIEIDDARSTDITYTYDWNHYGAPKITEDHNDPAHPNRVFIRYESARNPDNTWASFTAIPSTPLTPTDGHSCTNPSVNDGCEHFGVGYYGNPSAIKYHWLIDDGTGHLAQGPAVAVATPSWTYNPPVLIDPALPPDPGNIDQPANVVAAIPAPEIEIPAGKEFGPPVWMKVIKTTTHNPNPVALGDLISDDVDGDGNAEWQNREPDEVETEWMLVQNRADGGDGVDGIADNMGGGDEVVTRRYEFYQYNDLNPLGSGSIDAESGEAMCDVVAADNLHGEGVRTVTDLSGSHEFDCSTLEVVGNYIGAQMAGFAAEAPLGLIDHLPDAEVGQLYSPRTVVVGGNTPYTTLTVTGLPEGMSLGTYTDPDTGDSHEGVLFGTPTAGGDFNVTVNVTDASNATASNNTYNLHVAGGQNPPPNHVPTADNQAVNTAEDTGANITLTASDADNDPLSYTLEQPSHGTLTGDAPNLVYTPVANYNGSDSFTFKANDGHADSNVATVNITVTPVYDAPSAVADSQSTSKNTALTIPVTALMANDINPDNATLSFISAGSAVNGRIALVKNKKTRVITAVTFKPKKNFTGTGSFIYTISDGQSSSSAAVSISVN